MKTHQYPEHIKPHILPGHHGTMRYECLSCNRRFGIEALLYTCPDCGSVLLLKDENADALKKHSGSKWREIFDYRKMSTIPALKGIYRYHEFIGPILPLEHIVYLGEGHSPIIEATDALQTAVGGRFFFKNDGQNPSASFKDRGMASALSYINFLVKTGVVKDVLAVCASTGDTSAAAALYTAYLQPRVKSAVLLPHKKVTPQQLSQPLGSGATVFEVPGVFDDCMKIVEALSENYNVALLNSKNAWRILGQESYAYEIAQDLEYDMANAVIVLPIGNAGNITAVMSGFIKFYTVGVIDRLPKIIGVQSHHANPVYRYYRESDPEKRRFVPITVEPSVAQAAMIGNPVSMPRVMHLVEAYNRLAGDEKTFFVSVAEQDIMDWTLRANRNGHIACTHGGESLAGFVEAIKAGFVDRDDIGIIDSTAHALKFAGFTDMYFENSFPPDFEITPDPDLINRPFLIEPKDLIAIPAPGAPIHGEDLNRFVGRVSEEIAKALNLQKVA